EDKMNLRRLGEFIMFCLNTHEEFPIGRVFERGTFQAITRMDWCLLRRDFDEIDFNDPTIFAKMLGIYKVMCREHESDMGMIQNFENYLSSTEASPPDALREAYTIAMVEEQIQQLQIDNELDKIKRHLPQIQAAIKKVLIEKMQANFAPLHAIAVGMKRARFNSKKNFAEIQSMQPAELDALLQGRVSKEDIVQGRLVFNNIRADVQTWLKNWINRADEKKLEKFLFAVTGSRSMGNNERILVVQNGALIFHTCSRTIDLNCAEIPSEDALVRKFDQALESIDRWPGFNVR
ncbi:MAG: hypothetical protein LLG04_08955, partial [Parachlamydia sp.]|nr:hypothetical protein [Parachlamydia sp.]